MKHKNYLYFFFPVGIDNWREKNLMDMPIKMEEVFPWCLNEPL